MLKRTRVTVAVAALVIGGLTACSGPDRVTATPPPSTASSAPASTLACKGDDCGADNQEVNSTACPQPAIDYSPVRDVEKLTGVKGGEVVIRKSTAPGRDCDRLVWAKLRSTDGNDNLPGNTQAYVLELTVEDSSGEKRVVKQESDNPALGALTVAVKVRKGQKVTACVRTGVDAPGGECVEVQKVA